MRPQGGQRLANNIKEKLHLHGKLPLPPGRQQGADSGGEVSNSLPASTCITFSECVRFPGKQELSDYLSIPAVTTGKGPQSAGPAMFSGYSYTPRPLFFPNRPPLTYWTRSGAGRYFSPSVLCRYSRMCRRVSRPTKSTHANGPMG